MPSNNICVSKEGPANALALNKDCSQVVIAGRNVFKVYSIEKDDFQEVCNLRVGKNLNLNFSSIDVAWSKIQENTLATAATNGAVVVWNLGKSGRSKQEHVFCDHKRTVNKVSFHLTDPSLLISGSQDGMMKCFDLRMKEVARTFLSNTEAIRDVQFSPHTAHTFAAVSENGNVQLWDVRRAERFLHQFTAHSGPVFACDWHPEHPWLATASRDKTIKVWDIHGKPSLEHTIYTIASVGHVKWRPQKKYHIASCALVLDSTVNVWDVRRPHVPFATFDEHRDVITAIAWQADPDVFLSTSRDSTLYRHNFRWAAHPIVCANPHAVGVSARGDVTLAVCRYRQDKNEPLPTFINHRQQTLGRSQQQTLETQFPLAASSQTTRWRNTRRRCALVRCAERYRLRGAPVHQLCGHNAEVARDSGKEMVAHVWDVVGAVYRLKESSAGGAGEGAREGGSLVSAPPLEPAPDARQEATPYSYNADDEPEPEEWTENQFHNSGVLGLPKQSIYIRPIKLSNPKDDSKGWVTAASAHYVDVEAAEWGLPQEAFPLRAVPPLPPPLHPAPPAPVYDDDYAQGAAPSTMSSSPEARRDTGSSGGSAGSQLRSSDASKKDAVTAVEDAPPGELQVRAGVAEGAGAGGWRAAPLLAAALRLHVELGDVQTAVCVMMVLGEHRSDLFPYIEESLQEHWLLGYLELLQRNKLYNIATELIRSAWVGAVWQLSQQSTAVHAACGRCGRRLPRSGHASCDRCQAQPALCAVCHQMVRGLFVWCQGCTHGGHLLHMQRWLQTHKQCPAGCGHLCQYT